MDHLSLKSALAAAVMLPAANARSQPRAVFHADLTLAWTEVIAGTNIPIASPNGILEPGEGARIAMSVSFTPVGTQVSYNYPTGGIAAPVAGFRAVTFDVIPTQTQGGSWSNPTTTSGFTGGFGIQFPGEEQLNFCSIFQPQPPLGSYPISTNPLLAVWRQVWTPSTYASRAVTFRLRGVTDGDPQAYVFLGSDPSGNPTFGFAYGNGTYGQTLIPIVPAPGSVAMILGLGILATRRRR